jgi:hypothetical protein
LAGATRHLADATGPAHATDPLVRAIRHLPRGDIAADQPNRLRRTARDRGGTLLGGQLVETNSPWMQGDFTDSAVGGHGNILRFFNESFAEATDPHAMMHFELVEFQNRKKPVAAYGIADIAVGYVGFEVQGIDAVLARAREVGARVVSEGGVVKLNDKTRAVLIRDPDVGGFVELFEPANR